MDDLKIRIWDYLYRFGHVQPIEAIAQGLNESEERIQLAVSDPWFDESNGQVAIAQSKP